MSSAEISSSTSSSHRSRSRSPGEIPLHSHSASSSSSNAQLSTGQHSAFATNSAASAHHSEYAAEEYDYGGVEHRIHEDGESGDQRRHRSNGDAAAISSSSATHLSSATAANSAVLGLGPPHPADNNPPTRRIYVGNLPLSFNNDDLYRLFAAFGSIRESFVTKDTHTGRSKQFGFVEFENDEQAMNARNSMIGSVLDQYGNKVVGEDDSLIMNGKNPLGELRHKIRIRFAELKKHDESLYMEDRLYISNLPDYITDSDLRNKFEQFGELTEASFATAKDTRQRLGSAFVQYKDAAAAKNALETLNGTHWNERETKNAPLRINFARKQRNLIREERMAQGRGAPRQQYDAPRSNRRTSPTPHAHAHYPPPPPHHYAHHYPPHHYPPPPPHAYPPYSYPYPYPPASNSAPPPIPHSHSHSHSRSSYEGHRERSRSRSREREHRYEREGRRETRRRSRSRTRSRSRSPRRREREQHSHRDSHVYPPDAYAASAYPPYAPYAYPPDAAYYPNAAYPPTSAQPPSSSSSAAHRDELDGNHRTQHSAHTHRRREDHAYHTDDTYAR